MLAVKVSDLPPSVVEDLIGAQAVQNHAAPLGEPCLAGRSHASKGQAKKTTLSTELSSPDRSTSRKIAVHKVGLLPRSLQYPLEPSCKACLGSHLPRHHNAKSFIGCRHTILIHGGPPPCLSTPGQNQGHAHLERVPGTMPEIRKPTNVDGLVLLASQASGRHVMSCRWTHQHSPSCRSLTQHL